MSAVELRAFKTPRRRFLNFAGTQTHQNFVRFVLPHAQFVGQFGGEEQDKIADAQSEQVAEKLWLEFQNQTQEN